MRLPKFAERFKEVIDEVEEVGVEYEPDGENRVQKEAYVCKRLKMTRSKLYETCISTGIDVMYDELKRKSGSKTGKKMKPLPCAGCGELHPAKEMELVRDGEEPYWLCAGCAASGVRVM